MGTLLLQLLLLQHHLRNVFALTNCSALNAYVQVTSPSNLSSTLGTLTSSYALFAPYSYYIPSTPLIALSSSDNPCSLDGIDTSLSGHMVLIFESDNCTSHYMVYVAQQSNATAVLLVNDDLSGGVVVIEEDHSLQGQDTQIPARSIPYEDGIALTDALSSGMAQSGETIHSVITVDHVPLFFVQGFL